MKRLVFLFLSGSLLLSACSGGSDHSSLGFLEASPPGKASILRISNYIPSSNPVVMTTNSTKTFAITAASDSPNPLNYEFTLDGTSIFKGPQAFYELDGQGLSAGHHELRVTVVADSLSESHLFQIHRNSLPLVGTTTPANSGSTVRCDNGHLDLSVQASDADGDPLSFTWKYNSASNPSLVRSSIGANSSTARFTPTCSQTGVANLSVEISDGYEVSTYVWTVGVGDPSTATITGYTPLQNQVTVASTGSQTFSISATGKAPLTYEWRLDGNVIVGATNSIYSFNATSSLISTGPHNLTVTVSDPDSSDSRTWTVVKNAPPQITSFSPSQTTFKVNYRNSLTFTAAVTDANSDNLTYEWRLNGILGHTSLTPGSSTGSTFAQLLSNSMLVGNNIIELKVTDGIEPIYQRWNVTLNYFSNECNAATGTGKVCTLAGAMGLGDSLKPGISSEASRIYVQPSNVIDDGQGNLFIADSQNHVVWFYNRSNATVRIATKDIQAGAIVALIGNGANGMTADGSTYNNFKLSSPQGMVWLPGSSPSENRLFIADYGNNRVVMMDGTGAVQKVMGRTDTTNTTATNADGVLAGSHLCSGALGLAYNSLNKRLYVTCRNLHAIKAIDTSDPNPQNWPGYFIAGRVNASGAVGAGSADGPIGYGTATAQLRYPRSIVIDSKSSNRSLYFTEERDTCRVRVINLSGSSPTYFGYASAPNNQVTTIAGTYNSCPATSASAVAINGGKFYNPTGLSLHEDPSGNLLGIFLTEASTHRVLFLNNTTGPMVFGGVTVPSYQMHSIIGNGTGDYNGNGQLGLDTLVNTPLNVTWSADKTKIMISDRGNNRVRQMTVSSSNGTVSTLVGQASRSGFLGDIPMGASEVYLNGPTAAVVDSSGADDLLYFGDSNNGRIRTINLNTGLVSTLLGKGIGNGNIENETPVDVLTRQIRGLLILGSNLIYTDRGTNNCQVRIWNRSSSPATNIFGVDADTNSIVTIAGRYNLGCGIWDPSYENALASTVRLNSVGGITHDSTGTYISNSASHCILKMDSAGIIRSHIGLCETSGNVNGSLAGTSIRLRNPTFIVADPRHPGNLFIVDQTDVSPSAVKYANFSNSPIWISDIEVAAGQILSVASSSGYYSGFATFENQICFASGYPGNGDQGSHNVICKNRDDDSGNVSIRIGPTDASLTRGGAALNGEQENVAGTSVRMYSPMGLTFDRDGNLYILENSSHVIRRVNRW